MRWFPVLFFATILCLGCGNSAVSRTTVHADGSWIRTIEYKISRRAKDSASKAISERIVPPQGPAWKAVVLTQKNVAIWRGSRTLHAGESLSDIQLKGWNSSQKAVVVASNLVTVTKLGNGTYEYLESIRWHGKIAKVLSRPHPPLASALRPFLPENMRQENSVGQFVVNLQREVFRSLVGLNSPLQLAPSQQQGEQQFKERLRESIILQLVRQSPTPLTTLQLRKASKEILDKLEANDWRLLNFGQTTDDVYSDLTITSSLKFPGDLIETNGLVNWDTGEISWKFAAEAAMLGRLHLRCVFKIKEGGEGHRARQAQSRR